MDKESQFLNNILPGNYWITKSMEFVKVKSSGTLWYLKKWMVYYYYIFLKKELLEEDYAQISQNFESFINSLDVNVKESARDFFFKINIGGDFIRFSDFARNKIHFNNLKEKQDFILTAKKIYFTYLMDVGGQSAYKLDIKNWIYEGKNFENIRNSLEEKLKFDGVFNTHKFNEIINDYHAVLRNERQIFFYFGFFHGKEAADLSGFYKLTNIGKSILNSSFNELSVIWEHQKLKMISQSPVTEITNIVQTPDNSDHFAICYHPYVTLLEYVHSLSSITCSQYQYVISKTNSNTNVDEVIDELKNKTGLEEKAMHKAIAFSRSSEVSSEDFLKELKKYILGICDLRVDKNTNKYSCLSWINANKITITNKERLETILGHYRKASKYLDQKYENLYKEFEFELKRKYESTTLHGVEFQIDEEIKYNWYKYIINFDFSLIIGLIFTRILVENNNISNEISKSNYSNYENLLKSLGVKKTDFVTLMADLNVSQFELITISHDQFSDHEFAELNPKKTIVDVNIQKIKQISLEIAQGSQSTVQFGKTRNSRLIQLIKSFYIQNFTDKNDGLIGCDVCKTKTFITASGEPYLEFHHIIPFGSDNGPDHYSNIVGICPMCHRKLHYMKAKEKIGSYNQLSENNNINKKIDDRINELYDDNVLEPLNLDFLRKEQLIDLATYEKLYSQMKFE